MTEEPYRPVQIEDVSPGDLVHLAPIANIPTTNRGLHFTVEGVHYDHTHNAPIIKGPGVVFDMRVWEVTDLVKTSLLPTKPGIYMHSWVDDARGDKRERVTFYRLDATGWSINYNTWERLPNHRELVAILDKLKYLG